MTRPIRATLVCLLIVHALAMGAWAGMREDVERLVRNAGLKGATVAVSIRDCDSGVTMVAINPDRSMVPASNMKLLTTGSALHALGPDFEFITRLRRDGERLIIVGDGDPAFGDPDLLSEMTLHGQRGVDVESFLDLWVKSAVDAGMKTVTEVVVDDRIFERDFVHPNWPADQLNNRYCAQVAGLNFHGNVLHFFPRPRPGQPPTIADCRPQASWLKLINNATSRDGTGERTTIGIHRKQDTNDFTFRGNLRSGYRDRIAVTVHDVPAFFARLFANRLIKAGLTVGNHRLGTVDDPASPGQTLGPIITTPMATILKRCNTDSENLYAECLLKRIGAALTGEPGSWINGSATVRHIIHQRLNDPGLASGIIVADGSGLSAANRVTAAAMTAWLKTFHDDEKLGPVFMDSLAMAGYSGTLQKRYPDKSKLHGAIVQAKTGYISQVSCLSGFVTMPDGRRRSFSVLVNGLKDPATVGPAKKLQDQIVMTIAQDMAMEPAQLGGD